MGVDSIQDVNLWANTLLKNMCHVQEIKWLNSASCFVGVHFGTLVDLIWDIAFGLAL